MLIVWRYLAVEKLRIFIGFPHFLQALVEHFLHALALFWSLAPGTCCRRSLEHDQPAGIVIVKAGENIGMDKLKFEHITAF
jgi:hypothetical protein